MRKALLLKKFAQFAFAKKAGGSDDTIYRLEKASDKYLFYLGLVPSNHSCESV